MGVPKIVGKYVLVTTLERVYAGRVDSVTKAGDVFPHHELYLVFKELKKFNRNGWEEEKGNFGVPDLFVSNHFGQEIYSLDENREEILKGIEKERWVTAGIKKGLKRLYPV